MATVLGFVGGVYLNALDEVVPAGVVEVDGSEADGLLVELMDRVKEVVAGARERVERRPVE